MEWFKNNKNTPTQYISDHMHCAVHNPLGNNTEFKVGFLMRTNALKMECSRNEMGTENVCSEYEHSAVFVFSKCSQNGPGTQNQGTSSVHTTYELRLFLERCHLALLHGVGVHSQRIEFLRSLFLKQIDFALLRRECGLQIVHRFTLNFALSQFTLIFCAPNRGQ